MSASLAALYPPLVKRTTLIVRDAERSLRFYRDVLGLTVWYDDQIELSGVGLAAGLRTALRPGLPGRGRLLAARAEVLAYHAGERRFVEIV